MLYRSLRVVVTDWGNQRGRIFSPLGSPLVQQFQPQTLYNTLKTFRICHRPYIYAAHTTHVIYCVLAHIATKWPSGTLSSKSPSSYWMAYVPSPFTVTT